MQSLSLKTNFIYVGNNYLFNENIKNIVIDLLDILTELHFLYFQNTIQSNFELDNFRWQNKLDNCDYAILFRGQNSLVDISNREINIVVTNNLPSVLFYDDLYTIESLKEKFPNVFGSLINPVKWNNRSIHRAIIHLENAKTLNLLRDHWIKPNFSYTGISEIIKQKEKFNIILNSFLGIVTEFENSIDIKNRHELIGKLIDIGFTNYSTNRSHIYACNNEITSELSHQELTYQYFITRFNRFENGLIFDKKLNLFFYIVPNNKYNWHEANKWYEYIPNEEKLFLQSLHLDKHIESNWRLPNIIELVTLITPNKIDDLYIDTFVFSSNVKYFWSSTHDENEEKAFYVETIHGQVLLDGFTHHNGIILCSEKNISKPLKIMNYVDFEDSAKQKSIKALKQLLFSEQYYKVNILIFSNQIEQDDIDQINSSLRNTSFFANFNYSPNDSFKFLSHYSDKNLTFYNCTVCIIERSSYHKNNLNLHKTLRHFVNISLQNNLPVIIMHNLSNDEIESCLSISEVQRSSIKIQAYSDFSSLPTVLRQTLEWLLGNEKEFGWVKESLFINAEKSIADINCSYERLDQGNEVIKDFVKLLGNQNLEEKLIKNGILPPSSSVGKQKYFVSLETPVQQLMEKSDKTKPTILFVRFLNRFSIVKCKNNPYRIVYDSLLNINWMTDVKKNLSIEQALEHAIEISTELGQKWRLPSIQELISILTKKRGERKFMDESIFPSGRWFWALNHEDVEHIYFVDFNFLYESVGREDRKEITPPILYKTAILVQDLNANVCNFASPSIFISYRWNDEPGYASYVASYLGERFGKDSVSFDAFSKSGGNNFLTDIEEKIRKCKVFLLIIGQNWVGNSISNINRLFESDDLVRFEVEIAQKYQKTIIPILINDATFNNSLDLPITIKNIIYKKGVHINHSTQTSDVENLFSVINDYL